MIGRKEDKQARGQGEGVEVETDWMRRETGGGTWPTPTSPSLFSGLPPPSRRALTAPPPPPPRSTVLHLQTTRCCHHHCHSWSSPGGNDHLGLTLLCVCAHTVTAFLHVTHGMGQACACTHKQVLRRGQLLTMKCAGSLGFYS